MTRPFRAPVIAKSFRASVLAGTFRGLCHCKDFSASRHCEDFQASVIARSFRPPSLPGLFSPSSLRGLLSETLYYNHFKPKQSTTMGGHVYIMCSMNNTTLYTGVTSNLPARVMQHKEKVYPNSFFRKL
ncbi:MAG: GIY-YIG nuclease family protein [Bacteroidota bacterium]